jgi:hypothetical protein
VDVDSASTQGDVDIPRSDRNLGRYVFRAWCLGLIDAIVWIGGLS